MVTARLLNKRSTTIIIAAVLALGTGLLAFNYLSTISKVSATRPMRSVVIASRDIAVRTVVTPGMLTVMNRPADSIEPDAVSNPSDVVGQIALISIPSGGMIAVSKVGRLGLGGLTVRIPAGQRAVSISLDRVKGVADLIKAGDHVDVIAVMQNRGSGSSSGTASTILSNKTVLAMGSTQEAPDAAAAPTPDATVETATLAVTPAEAKTLTLADLTATLRLALRSAKDTKRFEKGEPFGSSTTAIPVPVPAATAALATPALAIAKATPSPKHHGPPLIDGDHYVNL